MKPLRAARRSTDRPESGTRRARRLSQSGFTLIEVLVALALLAISSTAIVVGTGVLSSSSSSANQLERGEVLLTSFGEALKSLPYQTCTAANVYQAAFDTSSDPDVFKLSQRNDVSLVVDGISIAPEPKPPAYDCGLDGDPGFQTLQISATVDGRTSKGQIVKRDTNDRAATGKAVIEHADLLSRSTNATWASSPPEELRTTPGDPTAIYSLSSTGSYGPPPFGIVGYSWDCDALDDPVTGYTATGSSTGPTVECDYNASTVEQTKTVKLSLDLGAGKTTSVTANVTVGAQPALHAQPAAAITVLTTPCCTSSAPVAFLSSGVDPDGRVVKWEWNFGDPTSGDAANIVVCTANIADACTKQTHAFNIGSPAGTNYRVTLIVTDVDGVRSNEGVANVSVVGPATTPTADFTVTPSTGIAPQAVTVNASASHAYGQSGGITGYSWRFDANGCGGVTPATGTGVTATRTYTAANSPNCPSYMITLTVTSAGGTNSTTRTVTLTPFVAPQDFRTVTAVGELKIPWCYGFFTNCQSPHGGHFYLAWTQGAHAADDKYRITISGVSGLCAAGFGTRTRDVPSAGNAGQSYDWAENSWPTWVCGPVPLVNWFPTTYRVQIQTLRADGTLSDPVGSTVTITTTRMP